MEPSTVRRKNEIQSETRYERWKHWPVNWTAVIVGALAALAVSMIVALCGTALGAYHLMPEHRLVDLRKAGFWVMAVGVFGSFFAFVLGGWIAGKIAGILHSEPAMLHGAIVWLTAVPMLALFTALGSSGYSGTWYGGLSNRDFREVPIVRPEPLPPAASDLQRATFDADWAQYRRQVAAWNADTPRVVKTSALCAVSALLIGLLGSVIGGWMSSGEPMSVRYRRPVAVD